MNEGQMQSRTKNNSETLNSIRFCTSHTIFLNIKINCIDCIIMENNQFQFPNSTMVDNSKVFK